MSEKTDNEILKIAKSDLTDSEKIRKSKILRRKSNERAKEKILRVNVSINKENNAKAVKMINKWVLERKEYKDLSINQKFTKFFRDYEENIKKIMDLEKKKKTDKQNGESAKKKDEQNGESLKSGSEQNGETEIKAEDEQNGESEVNRGRDYVN